MPTHAKVCPVASSLDLVGDRWTLLIVRDLLSGAKRFQDLQDSVAGIAPATLSARLKNLEEQGLAERRMYSEHPPRANYALTGKGRELGMIVAALAAWGSRHVPKTSSPVTHAACGHQAQTRMYCPHCEAVIGADEVEVGLG